MKRFEYLVLTLTTTPLEEVLNFHGDMGWELVQIINDHFVRSLVFKRDKA